MKVRFKPSCFRSRQVAGEQLSCGERDVITVNLKSKKRSWNEPIFQVLEVLFEHGTHGIDAWYIYLHEWLIFMGIGKYTSPMDPMG